MKRERPGEAFEAAFRASIPRGVYVRRPRTPTAMGFVVPRRVGLVGELCKALGRPVPEWATAAARFRFTPRAGFDLLLAAAARGVGAASFESGTTGGPVPIQACLLFALELKSVDGTSIAFAQVDHDQERALAEAAEHGHAAFVVIEFRPAAEVWAVPIQRWQRAKAESTRKSLPLTEARLLGMQIRADVLRGRSRPYWQVEEWLARCGAMPMPGAKKARRGKPRGAKLEPPDWSPGDVIAAERDGTIVLDDGTTTWNDQRAYEFLARKAAG